MSNKQNNRDIFEEHAQLITLLERFREVIHHNDAREKVLALVPAYTRLNRLGKTLIPNGLAISASDRLLTYFQKYPNTVLKSKELAVVAGISEWARRVRELRVQAGWKIISGITAKKMIEEGEISESAINLSLLGPDDYMMIDTEQDKEAAFRWHFANTIRKKKVGGKEKILEYLVKNVGKQVTGDELAYVASSKEWARRVRELRTEEGWPISTKMTGNPSLPVGVYILEEKRQAPKHDRHIPESVRRNALQRDDFKCQKCGWNPNTANRSDKRFLELHHIIHHADKGPNNLDNLITLCNICHDELHKKLNKK